MAFPRYDQLPVLQFRVIGDLGFLGSGRARTTYKSVLRPESDHKDGAETKAARRAAPFSSSAPKRASVRRSALRETWNKKQDQGTAAA
ncbi:hypothetical protein E4U56_007630 [Claviceps arundinis]|uniref:Uncharacterized protein n=1 Tax=Claviceps arundinis TaxID=1623583 RepID=A0A9P7MUB7_9HYPO|nr:hypothetical protein E4U56_007630 [Claviceps arundinis]